MSELLSKVAELLNAPESLVQRSAEARAEASGRTVDEVLQSWAGGESVASVEKPAEEAPPIQEVTKNLVRQEIPNLSYKGEILRLNLDEINLMQCRIIDKDPSNVAEILNFLQEEGYDPTQLPPAVVRFRGEYYLINGHHQYDALKQRGQTLWIFDVYEWNGQDDFDVFKSFLKALGRKINLSGTVPKKDQTPIEIGNGLSLIHI